MRAILPVLPALLLALGCSQSPTGPVTEEATVNVPVQHEWMYYGNHKCSLDVEVSGEAGKTYQMDLALVTDLSLMGERDTVLLKHKDVLLDGRAQTVTFNLGRLKPGFYQVNLTGTEPFNIGCNPEKIASPQDKQPDFDAFWEANLAELASVEPEYTLTLLPERSNDVRNVYRVEMKSLGGAVIGGYYAEPVAEGTYPAYLDYMGYGADPFIYDPSGAPQAIEFLVSVRDQGIFKADNERWIDRGLGSKEEFYYRGAFCDVVRAIDFMCSREKVDKDLLFARGESQGGAFTYISASLDHRIKAIAPAVPFLGDYEDYGKIVWWPVHEVYDAADKEGIDREELHRMLTYFDVKNFTDRIECPVYMAFGLQDPTCPPHTNFSEYNMVRSEKKYMCVPLCGHAMWQQQCWSDARAAYFQEFINEQRKGPEHTAEASDLLAFLIQTADSGKTMYGMQDALMYGKDWHLTPEDNDYDSCDVKTVCGDYPAILGLDMGGIELGSSKNLDGNEFSQMRGAAIRHYERGGILTFSWHLRNPLTGGDTWDTSSDKVVESILPGGENHDKFMGWLSSLADFFDTLVTEDGTRIPFIFRPWHEHTGSWFWWGKNLCTAEQYNALWAMTFDYLAGVRGLTNMLWATSPDQTNFAEGYVVRYPGDAYVDIIGLDQYSYNIHETALYKAAIAQFSKSLKKNIDSAAGFAKMHGKAFAVTETGLEGMYDPTWWTAALASGMEGCAVSYVLTWRNAWDKDGHYFAPYPGAACEQDFVQWAGSDKILLLNDIKNR